MVLALPRALSALALLAASAPAAPSLAGDIDPAVPLVQLGYGFGNVGWPVGAPTEVGFVGPMHGSKDWVIPIGTYLHHKATVSPTQTLHESHHEQGFGWDGLSHSIQSTMFIPGIVFSGPGSTVTVQVRAAYDTTINGAYSGTPQATWGLTFYDAAGTPLGLQVVAGYDNVGAGTSVSPGVANIPVGVPVSMKVGFLWEAAPSPATGTVTAQGTVGLDPSQVFVLPAGFTADAPSIGLAGNALAPTVDPWSDVGHPTAGTHGWPVLEGLGTLLPQTSLGLRLSNALEDAPAFFVAGAPALYTSVLGAVLVPTPNVVVPSTTDGTGEAELSVPWPPTPPGAELFFQAWIIDPGAGGGFAASNGMQLVSP